MPSCDPVARRVTCDTGAGATAEVREPKHFDDGGEHCMACDAVDAPTVLAEFAPELRAIEVNSPNLSFHALREHSGAGFQNQLDG